MQVGVCVLFVDFWLTTLSTEISRYEDEVSGRIEQWDSWVP